MKRFYLLLKRYEDAVRHHEMIGSLNPEEHEAVEKEFKISRIKLIHHVKSLQEYVTALEAIS